MNYLIVAGRDHALAIRQEGHKGGDAAVAPARGAPAGQAGGQRIALQIPSGWHGARHLHLLPWRIAFLVRGGKIGLPECARYCRQRDRQQQGQGSLPLELRGGPDQQVGQHGRPRDTDPGAGTLT